MERIFRTTDFIRRAAMLLLLLVTTGLRSMDNGQWTMGNGAWYDLQGRIVTDSSSVTRHSSLPRGIYIHNGKKVIIK